MKDYFGKDCSKLKDKKLWLFDMDGTVYLGDKIFDGTLKLLDNIVESGGKYVFITNNSSKGIDDYLKKVSDMGIKAGKDNFYLPLVRMEFDYIKLLSAIFAARDRYLRELSDAHFAALTEAF